MFVPCNPVFFDDRRRGTVLKRISREVERSTETEIENRLRQHRWIFQQKDFGSDYFKVIPTEDDRQAYQQKQHSRKAVLRGERAETCRPGGRR